MSTQTFHLPDVGEGLTEAEIVTWKVRVGDQVTGTGTGASKKHAEQTAAAQAYQALVELTSGVTPGIA